MNRSRPTTSVQTPPRPPPPSPSRPPQPQRRKGGRQCPSKKGHQQPPPSRRNIEDVSELRIIFDMIILSHRPQQSLLDQQQDPRHRDEPELNSKSITIEIHRPTRSK